MTSTRTGDHTGAYNGDGYGFLDLSSSNIPSYNSSVNHNTYNAHVIHEHEDHDNHRDYDHDDNNSDYDEYDNDDDHDGDDADYYNNQHAQTDDHTNVPDQHKVSSSLSIELPSAYHIPAHSRSGIDDGTSTAATDMKLWRLSAPQQHAPPTTLTRPMLSSTNVVSNSGSGMTTAVSSLTPSMSSMMASSSDHSDTKNIDGIVHSSDPRTEFWSRVERILDVMPGAHHNNGDNDDDMIDGESYGVLGDRMRALLSVHQRLCHSERDIGVVEAGLLLEANFYATKIAKLGSVNALHCQQLPTDSLVVGVSTLLRSTNK